MFLTHYLFMHEFIQRTSLQLAVEQGWCLCVTLMKTMTGEFCAVLYAVKAQTSLTPFS